MAKEPGGVTELLHRWQTGDRDAESGLFELLMPELRAIAARCFRGERPHHTLQPTALVNEAFFRLAKANDVEWRDRGHFFAIASLIMRRLLIDHARGRPDAKLLPLDGVPEHLLAESTPMDQAVAIEALLEQLGSESPRQREIVELKFSLGLTDEEAAAALDMPLRSLQREWFRARKWLFERLTATPRSDP